MGNYLKEELLAVYESPLELGLTPTEIFTALDSVDCYAYQVLTESREHEGMVELVHTSTSKRTGNTCEIKAIEGDSDLNYFVELKVGDTYLSFNWQCEIGDRQQEAIIKACSHATYIDACKLIGVKVGYGLQTNPSYY